MTAPAYPIEHSCGTMVLAILKIIIQERPMFRAQLPRVYELRDLIADLASPVSYFQDFENRFQDRPDWRRAFVCWEKEFQGLDNDAWTFLKSEASPYLVHKDRIGRGWQQLFNILNQAPAYNYLKSIGCSNIRFIPRPGKQNKKTPDLESFLYSGKVLCEVKTINTSDREVQARRESTARNIKNQLKEGFFRKLHSNITEAKQQLYAYHSTSAARYFIYFNVCFDDFFGDYQEEFFRQIDQYLLDNQIPGIELLFRHDGPFTKPFAMTAATAVNAC
jgi:hypothetical protein